MQGINDMNSEILSTNTASSNKLAEFDKVLKSTNSNVKLAENQKENFSNQNLNQLTGKNFETKKKEGLVKDKQNKIEENIDSIQQE